MTQGAAPDSNSAAVTAVVIVSATGKERVPGGALHRGDLAENARRLRERIDALT